MLFNFITASSFRLGHDKNHKQHSHECNHAENVHAIVELYCCNSNGEKSKEQKRDEPQQTRTECNANAANLQKIKFNKLFCNTIVLDCVYSRWQNFGKHCECEWHDSDARDENHKWHADHRHPIEICNVIKGSQHSM